MVSSPVSAYCRRLRRNNFWKHLNAIIERSINSDKTTNQYQRWGIIFFHPKHATNIREGQLKGEKTEKAIFLLVQSINASWNMIRNGKLFSMRKIYIFYDEVGRFNMSVGVRLVSEGLFGNSERKQFVAWEDSTSRTWLQNVSPFLASFRKSWNERKMKKEMEKRRTFQMMLRREINNKTRVLRLHLCENLAWSLIPPLSH